MVSQLVVLHVRAVNDRHAKVDVEQDRHCLQLAHNDVADDADEWEQTFAVGATPRQLPDGALPLFTQPLEHRVQDDDRGANRVERDQERHARAAQAAIDRHAPPRRDGERDRLRVTVEQIHVTRPTGEGARRMNAVADVLHAARAVARDDEPRRFVVEAKRGNAVVLAVKDARLAVGRR